jgi:hypothetical protein
MPLLMVPPLVFVAAFIVAYGSSLTVRRWSAGMTRWLGRASWLVSMIVPVLGTYELKLVKYVAHELGQFATASIFAMARWLTGLRQYILVVGFWTLLWPVELYKFASWLVHRYIPQAIRAHTGGTVKVVHGVVKVVKTIEAKVVHVTKIVRVGAKAVVIQTVPRTVREATDQIQWLRRHWKALTAAVAGAGAIALPWGGAGRIERRVGSLAKRLGKLEKVAAGLGAAGLVLAALRRLKLGWLRCSNVGKVGRRLCGLDSSLIDLLLLDTVAIFSILSVREFAVLLASVEDEAVGIMGRLIREFPETQPSDRPA